MDIFHSWNTPLHSRVAARKSSWGSSIRFVGSTSTSLVVTSRESAAMSPGQRAA